MWVLIKIWTNIKLKYFILPSNLKKLENECMRKVGCIIGVGRALKDNPNNEFLKARLETLEDDAKIADKRYGDLKSRIDSMSIFN